MSKFVGDSRDWGLSVVEDRAVMVLEGGDESPVSEPSVAEGVDLALEVWGENLNYRINITGTEASLSDIVPVARSLSTQLALLTLYKLGRMDEVVPCRKGCSACCNYVIPLSIPEVFRFREEVLEMPGDMGRAVLQRCLDVSERIISKGPLECCGCRTASESSGVEANRVVEWYSGLDIACPLLSEGLCSYYDRRPAVCREHIVTGSAVACRIDGTDKSSDREANIAPVPISIVQALGELAAELEGGEVEAVMLPLALPWAEDNPDRSVRSWPAKFMVERFVGILRRMASGATCST